MRVLARHLIRLETATSNTCGEGGSDRFDIVSSFHVQPSVRSTPAHPRTINPREKRINQMWRSVRARSHNDWEMTAGRGSAYGSGMLLFQNLCRLDLIDPPTIKPPCTRPDHSAKKHFHILIVLHVLTQAFAHCSSFPAMTSTMFSVFKSSSYLGASDKPSCRYFRY
ncbi:hypothetical protein BDW22DRAFT_177003 [Trametopsis cervina]|nr:hypothetical protein BDW22DRAFT_177003 [Trametopsis cervina]